MSDAAVTARPSSGILAVLRTPGFVPLFGATLIGRLPLGAVGLLVILHVREIAGSYAAGGLAAGAGAISAGLAAPLLGRLVDRCGQAAVLLPAALVAGGALSVMATLGDGTPLAALVALAAFGGAATPPLSACLRALWPAMLDGDRLHAAFSLEAVAQELVYIAGPLLLVGVLGAHSTSLGLVAAGALTIVGTLLFCVQRHSRSWRPEALPGPRSLAGALASPGVRALMLVMALFGVGVGAIELAVAAVARREGHEGAAAVLLALWGLGSLVGGVVAARRGAPQRPGRELVRRFAWLGLLQLPLVLADSSLLALGAALTVAGFGIAPALAITFRVVSDIAPAGSVTEAFTWMTTGITAGIASGQAVAGVLVDGLGTQAGFALAAAAGLAAGAAALSRPSLREAGPVEPVDQFIDGSAGIRASSV